MKFWTKHKRRQGRKRIAAEAAILKAAMPKPPKPAAESPISHLVSRSKIESMEAFRDEMERSMLFRKKEANRAYAIKRALNEGPSDGLFVEFGVAGGDGCRLFGGILQPHNLSMTGFDSFEGLEEDWTGIQTGRAAGAFTQQGKLPDVPENVALVKGWVQDTLPGYLEQAEGRPFSFIHMDMDTYSPTRYALEAVEPFLVEGTVILFDELYGYPGWRHHEYKALQEVLERDRYEYISFSAEAVAIQIR